MIFSTLRVVVALLVGGAASSCTWYVYDATNRLIASDVAGRCFALREKAILSEHFSYFTAYMLNLPGANDCTPQDVTPSSKNEERFKASGITRPQCIWVPVANIEKETKIRVMRVTEQPYGGPGRCWKIEVKLISGGSAGVTSDIPACHFDFPESELWVRMKSEHEYVEPLQLVDRIAAPCTE